MSLSSSPEQQDECSSTKMEERQHTDEHRTDIVDGQSGLRLGQLQEHLQLQSLQLPNMPKKPSFLLAAAAAAAATKSDTNDESRGRYQHEDQQELDDGDNADYPDPPVSSSSHPPEPPTIRILVVADVDLESASALAEYAMINTTAAGSEAEASTASRSNPFFPHTYGGGINDDDCSNSRSTNVDLIIACGPFINDDYNLVDHLQDSRNTTVAPRPRPCLSSTTPCYYSSSTLARYYEGRARRNYLTRNYYYDSQNDDNGDDYFENDNDDDHGIKIDLDEDVEVIPMSDATGQPLPSSSSSSSQRPSFFMSPPVATSYSTSAYATSFRRMGGTGGRLGPSSSSSASSSTPSSRLDTVAIPTPLPPRINQPTHYELVENEVPGPSPSSSTACQTRHAYYNSRFRSLPYHTSGDVPYTTTSGQSHHHHHHRDQRQSSKTTVISSKEEMASKLGLVTATISQLESIVCRVVWIPPIDSDGINRINNNNKNNNGVQTWCRRKVRNVHELNTSGEDAYSGSGGVGKSDEQHQDQQQQKSQQDHQHLRLTPNSRNIHNSWLSLAPGLGIAGLCHGGNTSSSIGSGRIRKNLDTIQANPDSLGATTDFYEQVQKLVVECAPPISRVSDVPREERTHPQFDELYDNNESINEDDASSSDNLFQSILVTHCNDNHYGDCDDANTDVKTKQGNGSPLSTKDPSSIYSDSTIQKNVVLQIDAGSSGTGRSRRNTVQNVHNNLPVIVPGSLRKHGEFCIVDVAFMKDDDFEEDDKADNGNKDVPPSKSSPSLQTPPQPRRQENKFCKGRDDYRWRVQRTRFHSMLS